MLRPRRGIRWLRRWRRVSGWRESAECGYRWRGIALARARRRDGEAGAELAVLKRMLFGRSSERVAPGADGR